MLILGVNINIYEETQKIFCCIIEEIFRLTFLFDGKNYPLDDIFLQV
jgi:hypothetical protein